MCEYTFNQQNHIKLIKSVSKDIYNVTNDFHLKKKLLNILFFKYPETAKT